MTRLYNQPDLLVSREIKIESKNETVILMYYTYLYYYFILYSSSFEIMPAAKSTTKKNSQPSGLKRYQEEKRAQKEAKLAQLKGSKSNKTETKKAE
jgi:hypothetical protein